MRQPGGRSPGKTREVYPACLHRIVRLRIHFLLPMGTETIENTIARAKAPREGDSYAIEDDRVNIMSVSDGVVRYAYISRYGTRNLEVTIEEWCRIITGCFEREDVIEVSFA